MWIRIVLLLAICAGLGSYPQRAWAQVAVQPAPAATALGAQPHDSQGLGQTCTPAVSGIASCCDSTYWIVSSRQCLQYGGNGALCCQLEYFYAPGDGNLHPSTREQFHASLDPAVPVSVMVHGSFGDFEDVKTDSRLTFDWLRAAAGPLAADAVFFPWPREW